VSGIRIGFNADPDPAFLVNLDPDPGDFITKNWKKYTAEIFFLFSHFRNFFTFAGNFALLDTDPDPQHCWLPL
jgi:hypothetical protein